MVIAEARILMKSAYPRAQSSLIIETLVEKEAKPKGKSPKKKKRKESSENDPNSNPFSSIELVYIQKLIYTRVSRRIGLKSELPFTKSNQKSQEFTSGVEDVRVSCMIIIEELCKVSELYLLRRR